MSGLTVHQANELAELIIHRQDVFDEPLHTSVMVALLNAGDRFTRVACVAGEWSGTKGELPRGAGLPKCPNGHVLLEANGGRMALGYVEADS